MLTFSRLIRPRLALAFAALFAAGAVSAAPPATAASTTVAGPSVTGQGSGFLPGDLFPQWAGNPISFTIDARATPTTTDADHADGSFQVTHLRNDGSLYTAFSGSVTALTTAGQTAVVNGVITAADDPANPGLTLVGAKIALTFDNRPDGARVGFVWGFAGQPVAEGQGAVPFFPLADSSVVVGGDRPGPVGSRALSDPRPTTPTTPTTPARRLSGTATGYDPVTGGYYTLSTDVAVAPGAATQTAQGTFTYILRQPDIAKSTSYSGTISCLDVGGDEAIATGQITAAEDDPALIGRKTAWSIYDNGTTDWVTGILDSPATPVHACQAPLPLGPATSGRITVTG